MFPNHVNRYRIKINHNWFLFNVNQWQEIAFPADKKGFWKPLNVCRATWFMFPTVVSLYGRYSSILFPNIQRFLSIQGLSVMVLCRCPYLHVVLIWKINGLLFWSYGAHSGTLMDHDMLGGHHAPHSLQDSKAYHTESLKCRSVMQRAWMELIAICPSVDLK